MNYIVVHVDQDCEYVEGVRHIASFPTEDAANAFVKEKRKEEHDLWQKRFDYIEEWVDAIDVPETSFRVWQEFITKWLFITGSYYSSPANFKTELKMHLRTNHSVKYEGYDPPSVNFEWNDNDLHVVELRHQ